MTEPIVTPHDILIDILVQNFPAYSLVAKPARMFAGKNAIPALIQQLNFVLRNILVVAKTPSTSYVFREFDCFYLLFILLPRRDLIFNVNHNLSTGLGRLVCKLLSTRYRVAFIDPSPDVLARFPYLVEARSAFSPRRNGVWDGRKILFICGNRDDQKWLPNEQLAKLTRNLRDRGYNVTAVGRNHPDGCRLSNEDYNRAAQESACICTSTYSDRHAGTLWYLKQRSPVLLFRWTNVAAEQVKGHGRSFAFNSAEELIDLLTASDKSASAIVHSTEV